MIDEEDHAGLRDFQAAGFTVHRRKHNYQVPTDLGGTRPSGALLPAGMSLISADAVDGDGLRQLDDALRQDVPGADGWVNDPQEFREYTFDDRHFDPATYLVAIDDVNQAYAGLARVWNNPGRPRLGLIGVTAAYRRRGLAKVLLAAVFAPLRDRGISESHNPSASRDEDRRLWGLAGSIHTRGVGGPVPLQDQRRLHDHRPPDRRRRVH